MNIGKLVSAHFFPEITDTITDLHIKTGNNLSRIQLEEKFNFPTYTQLSDLACGLWGLPSYIMESINAHQTKYLFLKDKISLAEFAEYSNPQTNSGEIEWTAENNFSPSVYWDAFQAKFSEKLNGEIRLINAIEYVQK